MDSPHERSRRGARHARGRSSLPELPHHSLFFTDDWDANFDAIFGPPRPCPPRPRPTSADRAHPTPMSRRPATRTCSSWFPFRRMSSSGMADPMDRGPRRSSEQPMPPSTRSRHGHASPISVSGSSCARPKGRPDFRDDYRSWRGGMLGPAHILSQSAMFRAQNASRRVQGLFYAGGHDRARRRCADVLDQRRDRPEAPPR